MESQIIEDTNNYINYKITLDILAVVIVVIIAIWIYAKKRV